MNYGFFLEDVVCNLGLKIMQDYTTKNETNLCYVCTSDSTLDDCLSLTDI